jgi:hypothetical protein
MALIQTLRSFRIQLDPTSEGFILNITNKGMALFDLASTVYVWYLLDQYFGLKHSLHIHSPLKYYLLLVPIFVVTHLLADQSTFLNNQLFYSSKIFYKIAVLLIFALITFLK